MPPAGRGHVPCTPFTFFFQTPFRSTSSVSSRAGQGLSAVRPSQASFASRPSNSQRAALCPKLKAGKHYEAREEVPADLVRPATKRDSHEECLQRAGGSPPAPHSCLSFLRPLRTASNVASRAGQGLSAVRPSQASFASRPSNGQRAALCPKLKAGKHYEAREEVPADLAWPAAQRDSLKNASQRPMNSPCAPHD